MKHIKLFENFGNEDKEFILELIFRSYEDFLDKYTYKIGEYDQDDKQDIHINVRKIETLRDKKVSYITFITINNVYIYNKNIDLLNKCFDDFRYYLRSYGYKLESNSQLNSDLGRFNPIINPFNFNLDRKLKLTIIKE